MNKETLQTLSSVIINNMPKYEKIGLDICKVDTESLAQIVRLKHDKIINGITFKQLLMNLVLQTKDDDTPDNLKGLVSEITNYANKTVYCTYKGLQEKHSPDSPLHWICERDAGLLNEYKL